MSISHALRIRRANAALIEEGNVDSVEEYFAPDYVAHGTGRDVRVGPDWVRDFVKQLRSAFPDLQVEVDILLEEGDRAAWQRTLRGTQQGDFKGFPACGKSVLWRDMVVSRFQDGLIAEDWAVTDVYERLVAARKG